MFKFKYGNISNFSFNDQTAIKSEYFLTRISEYKTTADKKRVFVSYLLLKETLTSLNIELDNLKISTKTNGKPFFADENLKNKLFFNLSHSKNLVVVAISDSEIGIDVQVLTDFNVKICNKFFNLKQQKKLTKKKNKNLLFSKYWAVYESELKLFGSRKDLLANTSKIKHKNFCLKDKENLKYFVCISSKKQ